MREYQKTKNNPYLLPHCLYMRVLYIIRDYGRLKSEAQGALCGAEGDGTNNMPCHVDKDSASNMSCRADMDSANDMSCRADMDSASNMSCHDDKDSAGDMLCRADNDITNNMPCRVYNRDLQVCPAYLKGILCKEKKGACSLVCAGEAGAIEEALGLIPEFFREPVLNNIIYGCRYPLGADERTFRRYKQRFVYYVAKCLALA